MQWTSLLAAIPLLLCCAESQRDQCPLDKTECGGSCVSTASDRNHCGGCDTACASGQTCIDGQCTGCNECDEDQQRCVQGREAYKVCSDAVRDACFSWGEPQNCPAGLVCDGDGQCVDDCVKQCSDDGDRTCAENGEAYRVCGQYDRDGCLDLSDPVPCQDGFTCDQGQCVEGCTDDCPAKAQRRCQGDGYEVCGDYDSDSCFEWGSHTPCPESTACNSEGKCEVSSSAANPKVFIVLHGTTFDKLTDAQMATLAKHYDMVLTSQFRFDVERANSNATQLKGYNSDIELLAFGNTRAVNLSGIQFDDCDGSEDLFAHYTDCEPSCGPADRIHNLHNGLIMAVSNPAWGAQIVKWVGGLNSDHDGLCLDSGGPSMWGMVEGKPYGVTYKQWRTYIDDHLEYVKSQLSSATVLFNGYHNWQADNDYAKTLDGGSVEGAYFGINHPIPEPEWIEQCVNTSLDGAAAGKRVLAVPEKASSYTTPERVFSLACHFLGFHPDYSYYSLGTDRYNALYWWPEYLIDIGPPIGTPTDMAALLDGNLYVREFDRGLVIVNMSVDADHTYTLTKDYFSLTFYGGGKVGADGSLPAGQIIRTYQEKGPVSVPAGSALILEYDPSERNAAIWR